VATNSTAADIVHSSLENSRQNKCADVWVQRLSGTLRPKTNVLSRPDRPAHRSATWFRRNGGASPDLKKIRRQSITLLLRTLMRSHATDAFPIALRSPPCPPAACRIGSVICAAH